MRRTGRATRRPILAALPDLARFQSAARAALPLTGSSALDLPDTAPRVHGMRADAVAPDWPALTLAELRALAPQFPALRGVQRILWTSPRPFSAAALVSTPSGECFVKRHDIRVRRAHALSAEHRFIAHLRARGCPVPQVLVDCQGATSLERGACTYEIHAPMPGRDAYRELQSWVPAPTAAHAGALGSALARLHLAAAGFEAPARPPLPLVGGIELVAAPDLAAAFDAFVDRRPALADYLVHTGGLAALLAKLRRPHAALHAALRAAPAVVTAAATHAAMATAALSFNAPALAPLWVHNDWHGSNVFWSADPARPQVVGIIDFGLCNRAWAVADLATALERNTIDWLATFGHKHAADAPIGRPELARALLAAYESVRPLHAIERRLLPLLLPLAHIDYALSEIDYFHGVVGNAAHAALARWDFLEGHIDWFAGPAGAAYLAAVRALWTGAS